MPDPFGDWETDSISYEQLNQVILSMSAAAREEVYQATTGAVREVQNLVKEMPNVVRQSAVAAIQAAPQASTSGFLQEETMRLRASMAVAKGLQQQWASTAPQASTQAAAAAGGIPPLWGGGQQGLRTWYETAESARLAEENWEASRKGFLEGFKSGGGGAAPPGGGDFDQGGIKGWWGRMGGLTSAGDTGSMMGLWRARAIQGVGDQIKRLGQQLEKTTREWADYANQADAAQGAMDRVAKATSGVTIALEKQLDPTTRLSIELGEQLVPYYDALADASDNLKMALVESSDGMQSLVATSTMAAGAFLKVAGGVVATLGGLAALKILSASVAVILGMSVGALALLAGGLGVAAGAATVMAIGIADHTQRMKVLEGQVLNSTKTWTEYQAGLQEVGYNVVQWEAAADGAGLTQEELNWQIENGTMLVGRGAAAYDDAKNSLADYKAVMDDISPEAILGASVTAYAMTPAFAGLFGQSAAAQEDIQNEMETKRREHAYVMEQIDKYGYDKQLVAQATALDAQIRQQELAMEKLKEATRSGVGSLVIQWIQSAVDLERLDLFQGIEMQLDVMQQMMGVSPETTELARQMADQLQLFSVGEQTWGETTTRMGWTTTEALTGILANLPSVNAETVDIVATHVTIIGGESPGGYQYLPLPPLREYSVADELSTQGVRTR